MKRLLFYATSVFSLKQLIYLGLFSIFLSVISISFLLLYSTSTINSTAKVLSQIESIDTQNKTALNLIVYLNQNQTKILMAQNDDSFNSIENKLLINANDLQKIKFTKFHEYEESYNDLIWKLKDDLNSKIIIQNNFFSTLYTLEIYKNEIDLLLFSLSSNINALNKSININNYNNSKFDYSLFKNSVLIFDSKIKDLVAIDDKTYFKNRIELLKDFELKILDDIKKMKMIQRFEFNEEIDKKMLEISIIKDKIIKLEKRILKNKSFLDENDLKQNKIALLINESFEKIRNIRKQINNDFMSDLEKENKIIKSITALIIFFSTVFLIVFAYILILRVNRPLQKIINGMQEIVENDEKLNENIEHDFKDEYKVLTNTFNKMTTKLDTSIIELKQKDEKISAMNKNLEILVEKRTQELSIKTQKVGDLLHNAAQGFLSFSKNILIDNEYSKECEKFLGKGLSNKNIVDILFENSSKKEFYLSILNDIFNEDEKLIIDSYLRLLPKEIILNKRALLLEYKFLENKRIMLIITNISSKKKLEKKIKQEQERVKMIVAIISNNTEFYEIIEDFNELIKEINSFIKSNDLRIENLNHFYRQIHTFKGLFSQVYMNNIVSYLHEVENIICELKDSNSVNGLKELLDTKILKEYLDYDLEIISSILGKDFLNDKNIIKIEEENFNYLEKLVDALYTSSEYNPILNDVALQIKRVKQKRIYDIFFSYGKLCFDEAKKLNKELHPLLITGSKDGFLDNEFKEFAKSLVHVFRNMIDHGIESNEKRSELEKDSLGTISCSYKESDKNLIIKISDDGAGLDIEKIKEKAFSLNLYTKEELKIIKDELIFSLIFEDSFSTKDNVSNLSGRGIGMSVVKEEVDKLKGSIKIASEINRGTCFTFILPKKEVNA